MSSICTGTFGPVHITIPSLWYKHTNHTLLLSCTWTIKNTLCLSQAEKRNQTWSGKRNSDVQTSSDKWGRHDKIRKNTRVTTPVSYFEWNILVRANRDNYQAPQATWTSVEKWTKIRTCELGPPWVVYKPSNKSVEFEKKIYVLNVNKLERSMPYQI
jgi:hypothetical protein